MIPQQNELQKALPGHIIIKLLKSKNKGKSLKAFEEKLHIINKGTPIQMAEDFSFKPGDQKELTHFSDAERKVLSPTNSVSTKNILKK